MLRPDQLYKAFHGGDFDVVLDVEVYKPCNPTHFRDKFAAAIKSVPGVRPLTPHSCRHTFVSQLQAQGVPMETIQSLAGHAEMDMTEHYLHVQDGVKATAVERLAGLIGA